MGSRGESDKDGLPLSGRTFCLTGTLEGMSRDEAKDWIHARGGVVVTWLGRATDFLVAGERPGSKLDRAKELGVAVLTEEDLIAMGGGMDEGRKEEKERAKTEEKKFCANPHCGHSVGMHGPLRGVLDRAREGWYRGEPGRRRSPVIRTYDVAFEGRTVCVDADVDLPRVAIYSLREHGRTEPRSFAGPERKDEGGKPYWLAFDSPEWTPERRAALFEAVRRAERARISAGQPG